MGAEFKNDQEIAANPALNQTYKLVERNSWLLSFGAAVEGKYMWQSYFELRYQNVIFNSLLTLCIFLGIVITFFNVLSK
jgi:hypothetical protein